ncbi:MAG: efflux RND transporter periplasmic adaptor subunit [Nitrospirae bacterium]|nr:efflux RND transporter periplasmic adaptor subunit [Nitrospirota bacterium]MCL5976832.1 efflux RND transporter periplasmic adaptor subunit [Nitrospirota bacterium]
MSKRNLIIIAAVGFAIGIFLYFSKSVSLKTIFQGKASKPPASQSSEHQGHATESGQQQTQAQPQEAPQEQQEPPTIEIPPDKQQLIGVKTVAVSVKPLQKIVRTVGRIEYDERRLATVNTKFEGWIEKLYIDYTGKYVKKGEPLAEIYSPELFATQQEFINVIKWAKQGKEIKNERMSGLLSKDAEAIIEAAKQRLKLWDITDAQIKKIEETGKPVRTLTVYSPVNGYIVQKAALQGMRIMPGEKLFDVADLSTVWVVSDIYEYELPLIKTGQRANISLSSIPGKNFSSAIDYVYPTLAGETRTAKVRFTISNPGGQLKPQMFTNVEIKINIGNKLAIPEDAIIDTGTRQIVYVDKGEGYFEPREVMLGVRAEGLREVTMGLKAGEKVASSATFLIDSEAKLKNVAPLGGHKH